MFACPNCGTMLDDTVPSCHVCGTMFSDAPMQQPYQEQYQQQFAQQEMVGAQPPQPAPEAERPLSKKEQKEAKKREKQLEKQKKKLDKLLKKKKITEEEYYQKLQQLGIGGPPGQEPLPAPGLGPSPEGYPPGPGAPPPGYQAPGAPGAQYLYPQSDVGMQQPPPQPQMQQQMQPPQPPQPLPGQDIPSSTPPIEGGLRGGPPPEPIQLQMPPEVPAHTELPPTTTASAPQPSMVPQPPQKPGIGGEGGGTEAPSTFEMEVPVEMPEPGSAMEPPTQLTPETPEQVDWDTEGAAATPETPPTPTPAAAGDLEGQKAPEPELKPVVGLGEEGDELKGIFKSEWLEKIGAAEPKSKGAAGDSKFKCPKCGAAIREGWIVCNECKAKL